MRGAAAATSSLQNKKLNDKLSYYYKHNGIVDRICYKLTVFSPCSHSHLVLDGLGLKLRKLTDYYECKVKNARLCLLEVGSA